MRRGREKSGGAGGASRSALIEAGLELYGLGRAEDGWIRGALRRFKEVCANSSLGLSIFPRGARRLLGPALAWNHPYRSSTRYHTDQRCDSTSAASKTVYSIPSQQLNLDGYILV